MKAKILIEEILRLDDLPQALWLSEIIGETLSKNMLGCFSSVEIEDHVFSLFTQEQYLPAIDNRVQETEEIAFVVTEPYDSGGHTRLMERLSGYLNQSIDLIVTRAISAGLNERLSSYFDSVFLCHGVKVVDRLLSLVELIRKYNKLVLFIHPSDIVAVTACRMLKKLNPKAVVCFVNHADHVFSYGVTIADYWLQISAYGDAIDCLRKGLTGKKTFIGIPVSFPEKSSIAEAVDCADVSLVISSGDGYKFKPKEGNSIIPLFQKILEMSSRPSVYVIGVNVISDYWWWCLKLRYFKRLKLIKKLQYDQFLDVTSRADIYVDSHPVPGGTAFVEQYLQGRYCIGLTTNLYGYSPVEKFKFPTVKEVFENRVFNRRVDESPVYEMIQHVHSPQEVAVRFLGTVKKGMVYENLNVKYFPAGIVNSMVFSDRLDYISPNLLAFAMRTPKLMYYIFRNSTLTGVLFAIARLIKRTMINEILRRG